MRASTTVNTEQASASAAPGTSTPATASNADLASSIPSVDFGGTGQPLHFLHANGYPPACYRPLIEELITEFRVFGMLLRPLWPGSDPRTIRDWKPFSQDLCKYLRDAGKRSVIGLGHSIGAVVSLRAALMQPDLFRALILIDPVLLPPYRVIQLRILHSLRLSTGLRVRIQAALRRRRRFDSLDQLFAGYRRRDVFRYFSDAELRALVEGITRPAPTGGFELVYSPEWEARIYETGTWNDWDLWAGIRTLKVPMLFLRGQETDTFFARTAELIQRRNPAIQVEAIPKATHLLPMERPHAVFQATKKFVDSLALEF